MPLPSGYEVTEELSNIPALDGMRYVLVASRQERAMDADAYIVGIDEEGAKTVLAFVDGTVGAAYRCDHIEEGQNPRDAGEEPLVKLVGELEGQTGQVVIKQVEGHWRRYSRWDRLSLAPATQPNAVVRTLPQCGCGGYLGAPMMFDSFNEMLSYFFVVFSDAEEVNAKHAAILNGGACTLS